MSKETEEQILQEILQELREIRKSSAMHADLQRTLNQRIARFDEFFLELSPSEAKEEIKDLKK
jgi:hypothetical protein